MLERRWMRVKGERTIDDSPPMVRVVVTLSPLNVELNRHLLEEVLDVSLIAGGRRRTEQKVSGKRVWTLGQKFWTGLILDTGKRDSTELLFLAAHHLEKGLRDLPSRFLHLI